MFKLPQLPDFEVNPIPSPWSKMLIVSGHAGGRGDLISGCLSNYCDKFIPKHWTIDPVWAKNNVEITWQWGVLPYGPELNAMHRVSLQSLVREVAYRQYDPTGRWAITHCHLSPAAISDIIPIDIHDRFFILDIKVSDNESTNTVRWESFAKNILRLFSSTDLIQHQGARNNLLYLLDKEMNDNATNLELLTEAYDLLCNLSQQGKWKRMLVKKEPAIPVTKLISTIQVEYKDIMNSNGLTTLSKALDISLSVPQWEMVLSLSVSRSEYQCFDKIWKRP